MSTIQTVNNGDTGLAARNKINQNFTNLNGEKVETSVFEGVLVSLADEASAWDTLGEEIGKAEVNYSANAIITLSNTLNKGKYYLKVTKTVAADVTIQILHAGITIKYPDGLTELVLAGAANTVYEIIANRYGNDLLIYSPSIPPAIIAAASVNVDDATFKVITSPTDLQDVLNQTDTALLNSRSTGVRFGGRGSVNGGIGVGTSVDITEGAGSVLNNVDAENPTFINISFTAKIDIEVAVPTNGVNTYWYYDDNTDVVKQTTTAPTLLDRKIRVYLFRTAFSDSVISGLAPEVTIVQQDAANIRETFEIFGSVKNQGLEPVFVGTALNISVTSGILKDYGINYNNSYTSANEKLLPTFDTSVSDVFRYATTSGTIPIDRTDLRVGFYQVAGVETAIPNPASNAGIHFIWLFAGETNNYRVSYGTEYYSSINDAVSAIGGINPLSTVPVQFSNATLLGAIVATKGTTNLQASATFISTNKFGLFGGGLITAGGSYLEIANNLSDLQDASVARTNLGITLQTSYDVSTANPEILTDATRGAVTIRRGSAADTDNIIEGQNNAGTTTFSVDGIGNIITGGQILLPSSSSDVALSFHPANTGFYGTQFSLYVKISDIYKYQFTGTYFRPATANNINLGNSTGSWMSLYVDTSIIADSSLDITTAGITSMSFDASNNVQIPNGKLTVTDRIALGLTAGDVTTPLEGEHWYNDITHKFRANENGVVVDMIGGIGASSSTELLWNNAGVLDGLPEVFWNAATKILTMSANHTATAGILNVIQTNATQGGAISCQVNHAGANHALAVYANTSNLALSVSGNGQIQLATVIGQTIGLFGSTPVNQAAAMTAATATVTNGTITNADIIINNLVTRVNELEAMLDASTGIGISA